MAKASLPIPHPVDLMPVAEAVERLRELNGGDRGIAMQDIRRVCLSGEVPSWGRGWDSEGSWRDRKLTKTDWRCGLVYRLERAGSFTTAAGIAYGPKRTISEIFYLDSPQVRGLSIFLSRSAWERWLAIAKEPQKPDPTVREEPQTPALMVRDQIRAEAEERLRGRETRIDLKVLANELANWWAERPDTKKKRAAGTIENDIRHIWRAHYKNHKP
jgi:hypothetical protein